MTLLDVLTLNLWGDNGPADDRMDALIGALRDDRPDVLALQEVAGRDHRTQAHRIATGIGLPFVHHIRSARIGRGEGLALVTHLDGEPTDPVYLPHGRDAHHRALQLVDVAVSGRAVRIGNTHLAWRLDATDLRTAQAEAIRAALEGWSGPIVLGGDLNDVAGAPPLTTLTEPAPGWDPLRDAYAEVRDDDAVTFDLDNPFMGHPELAGRRIDHVLVRGVEVRAAEVVLTGRQAVSDHYGVRVQVELPARDHGGGAGHTEAPAST